MLNEPRRLIVTILIGNELVNITASALSAMVIIRWFGLDNSYLNLLIVTPLLLIFGEITPKTLAIKNSSAFATFEAPLIQRFTLLITPLRDGIRFASDGIITLIVGKERTPGSLVTEDMVLTLTREAVGDGVLQTNEAHYIHQVFKFGEARVEDVMTPRSNVLFIAHDASPEEVIFQLKTSSYSKLPVYKEEQDAIIGVLFGRDLLSKNIKKIGGKKGLRPLLRDAYFVPGTRQVIDLFHHFRSKRISMALVLDEYGGIIGLVTMDDLLRCIFGDLPSISGQKQSANRLQKNSAKMHGIDALMPVTEFNRLYGKQLPTVTSHTLNGLVMDHYGELPKKGVQVTVENLLFTVQSTTGNRVNKLKVEPIQSKKKATHKLFLGKATRPSTAAQKVLQQATPKTIASKKKESIVDKKESAVGKSKGQQRTEQLIKNKTTTTRTANNKVKKQSVLKPIESVKKAKKSIEKKPDSKKQDKATSV